MKSAEQTYFGLGDVALAQARLGDLEAAKQSAIAIGEGPSRAGYDMTDGQPYALLRIATVQLQSGDTAGARATLRDAFRSVREHPDMRGRDGRYIQIASGQVASGDLVRALLSVRAASEISGRATAGRRAESLALIAQAQAAAGDHAAATATFARALTDAGLSVKDPPSPNPNLARLPGVRQNMPASEREPRRDSGDGRTRSGCLEDDPVDRRPELSAIRAATGHRGARQGGRSGERPSAVPRRVQDTRRAKIGPRRTGARRRQSLVAEMVRNHFSATSTAGGVA